MWLQCKHKTQSDFLGKLQAQDDVNSEPEFEAAGGLSEDECGSGGPGTISHFPKSSGWE